jgi:hypothetical protein
MACPLATATGGPAPPGHQAQEHEGRAQSGGPRDWLAPDGHPWHRPGRRRRILADAGDAARFPDRGHFAPWTGTAPIDASSGQHSAAPAVACREPPAGHLLYMAGNVHLRHDTAGRAYYRRKRAAGKTSMEAMRCLRRRLSDAVCRQLAADAVVQEEASGRAPRGVPGIQRGWPVPGHQHFGSATSRTRAPDATATPQGPKAMAPAAAATRRRARGDGVERPAGRTTLPPTRAAAPSTASGPCP